MIVIMQMIMVYFLWTELEDGKWGYVDTNGKLVMPYNDEDSGVFSEGVAVVKVDSK